MPQVPDSSKTCLQCGAAISESSLQAYCPKCLINLAETVAHKAAPRAYVAEATGKELLGRTFGDYELLEKIGEGGMGMVFKARQAELKRTVAVKMLRSGALASDAEVKRFWVEAQAAARLQHPNVVAIHDIGEQDGRLFFAMEYIPGRSLAEVVRRTPIAAGRAARYVKTIAETIHYAHQQGLLHRDLKPANVLIDANDKPRITDFGLAKDIAFDSTLTAPGMVLGTPSYMSPEQAAGRHKELTPASDVYSIGAILYDLLTGRPPFRAETPLDTLRQVVDTAPAAPRLVNPQVPRDLETICLKCLHKDPEHRYQTASELADDLGRFLRREPIQARPPSIAGRVWRWCLRNPGLGTLAAMTVLLGILQGISAIVFRHSALKLNDNTALIVAQALTNHLFVLSQSARELAANPELGALLATNNVAGVSKLLVSEWEKRKLERGVANWVVMDPDGKTVTRFPPPLPGRMVRENRHDRDYYTGAARLLRSSQDGVYFSKVYRSEEDELYKFGISTGVYDARRQPVGIVALMVSTGNAEQRLNYRLKDEEVFLLAPADPAWTSLSPPGAQCVFLAPDLTNGSPVRIVTSLKPLQGWLRDLYRGELCPGRGWRMVSTAPLPGTQYTVAVASASNPYPFFALMAYLALSAMILCAFGYRAWQQRSKGFATGSAAPASLE